MILHPRQVGDAPLGVVDAVEGHPLLLGPVRLHPNLKPAPIWHLLQIWNLGFLKSVQLQGIVQGVLQSSSEASNVQALPSHRANRDARQNAHLRRESGVHNAVVAVLRIDNLVGENLRFLESPRVARMENNADFGAPAAWCVRARSCGKTPPPCGRSLPALAPNRPRPQAEDGSPRAPMGVGCCICTHPRATTGASDPCRCHGRLPGRPSPSEGLWPSPVRILGWPHPQLLLLCRPYRLVAERARAPCRQIP